MTTLLSRDLNSWDITTNATHSTFVRIIRWISKPFRLQKDVRPCVYLMHPLILYVTHLRVSKRCAMDRLKLCIPLKCFAEKSLVQRIVVVNPSMCSIEGTRR